jgi:uncharacterized membrane protein YjjP (DUF1212 family)
VTTLDRWRLASAVGMSSAMLLLLMGGSDGAFWLATATVAFYLGLRIGARAAMGRWE